MTAVVESKSSDVVALNVESHNVMSLNYVRVKNTKWIIDSGATYHMNFDSKTPLISYIQHKNLFPRQMGT